MLREEVAVVRSAVPAEFVYRIWLPVKDVTPVPPRLRARVPVVSLIAMPRVEVAIAVGTALRLNSRYFVVEPVLGHFAVFGGFGF